MQYAINLFKQKACWDRMDGRFKMDVERGGALWPIYTNQYII